MKSYNIHRPQRYYFMMKGLYEKVEQIITIQAFLNISIYGIEKEIDKH